MDESNSVECNFIKVIGKTILSEQAKFRLTEITGTEIICTNR